MNENLIVVAGAAGDLGYGVSKYLLEQGVRNIAFHYRSSPKGLPSLLKEFDLPEKKHLFQADLTQEDSVRNLREQIEQQSGQTVWGLVNLAGGSTNSISWKMSLADFRQVIDQNLTSTFLSCREFIPGMRAQESGRIINTSSIVAFAGAPGAAHYGAAKAGITGLSAALALELAPKKIMVNTLALGYFGCGLINHLSQEIKDQVTSRIPLKRLGQEPELGSLVHYLLSPEATYMTGQVFHLNGGLYL